MSEKTDIVDRLLEIVAPREEQVCGGEGVKPVWGVWRHRDERLIREIAQEIKAELSAAAATIERLEAEKEKLVAVVINPADGVGFQGVLMKLRRGMQEWAEKSHNKRWWKRIDGTPIVNDLPVAMAASVCRRWSDGRPVDDGVDD